MGHNEDSPGTEIHSDTDLLKKIETFHTNTLIPHLQELKEQKQRQPRARIKEITKIRAELMT